MYKLVDDIITSLIGLVFPAAMDVANMDVVDQHDNSADLSCVLLSAVDSQICESHRRTFSASSVRYQKGQAKVASGQLIIFIQAGGIKMAASK